MACAQLAGDRATTATGPRAAALPVRGLAVVVLCGWWAVSEGGATPTVWCPGALGLLAVLVAVGRPRALRRLPRSGAIALAGLAAFAVWSGLSILWAQVPGDAWEATNRTLLYLTVFALFALAPWTAADATAVLAGLVLMAVAVGAWSLGTAIGGDRTAFDGGRLAAPVGYENASAALALGAFWPAVLLAARRATRPVLRAALLAAAGVLVALAILTQSRGSLIGAAAALAVALVATRERARLALALGAVALTTGASLPLLLAVYADDASHAALVRAALAIAVSAALLFAAGLASGRFDGRPALARRLRRRSAAALAIAALALSATVLVTRPASVSHAGAAGLSSRFAGGVESGRYDFWRVSVGQLARRPLLGAGAGNFAHDYARDGRGPERPLYPHSLVWATLGQTGLVGGLLLGTFLAAAFAGLAGLRADPRRHAAAVAASAAAAYWLGHASFDWLWELPAVTVPALACLGLVTGLGLREHRGGAGIAVRAALAVAAAVAAVSLALPALAARAVEQAARSWARDPGAALRSLDAARRLDPLSARPDAAGAALALASGDRATARRELARALDRDAHDWHAQAQLGVLQLAAGRRAAGLGRLERARALAPREPSVAAALAAARRGPTVPAAVQGQLARLAVQGPLGRRPITCRPVLGLAAPCTRRQGR